MSFPSNPSDGQKYTTTLGTTYVYSLARTAWIIESSATDTTGTVGYLAKFDTETSLENSPVYVTNDQTVHIRPEGLYFDNTAVNDNTSLYISTDYVATEGGDLTNVQDLIVTGKAPGAFIIRDVDLVERMRVNFDSTGVYSSRFGGHLAVGLPISEGSIGGYALDVSGTARFYNGNESCVVLMQTADGSCAIKSYDTDLALHPAATKYTRLERVKIIDKTTPGVLKIADSSGTVTVDTTNSYALQSGSSYGFSSDYSFPMVQNNKLEPSFVNHAGTVNTLYIGTYFEGPSSTPDNTVAITTSKAVNVAALRPAQGVLIHFDGTNLYAIRGPDSCSSLLSTTWS